eukprot:CAMPEP_0174264576 /NCGR_PEP_ID=MMETSP0439-20130205/22920_1 /TAXON_ID=0 /ORGANISM="Stereomyxa ramosa, Strain Chinc5" /LENGTH=265 /DNA_ID=CAMNT_0015350509 /DNA_START=2149 /DNA_END=2946 /DNA_ORIENTATION=-
MTDLGGKLFPFFGTASSTLRSSSTSPFDRRLVARSVKTSNVVGLQPSVYELPTYQIKQYMNLISQKDKEMKKLLRRKRKRKEKSHRKKKKKKVEMEDDSEEELEEIKEENKRKRENIQNQYEESEEEDEEEELFCICKSPEEYGFMICCDSCNQWFHGGCIGLSEEEGSALATYCCPDCTHPKKEIKSMFSSGVPEQEIYREPIEGTGELVDPSDTSDVEWEPIGERVRCGDGEGPGGFLFVSYRSYAEIELEKSLCRQKRMRVK